MLKSLKKAITDNIGVIAPPRLALVETLLICVVILALMPQIACVNVDNRFSSGQDQNIGDPGDNPGNGDPGNNPGDNPGGDPGNNPGNPGGNDSTPPPGISVHLQVHGGADNGMQFTRIAAGESVWLSASAVDTDVRWPRPEDVQGSFTEPYTMTLYTPPHVAGFYTFTIEAFNYPSVNSTVLVEVYSGVEASHADRVVNTQYTQWENGDSAYADSFHQENHAYYDVFWASRRCAAESGIRYAECGNDPRGDQECDLTHPAGTSVCIEVSGETDYWRQYTRVEAGKGVWLAVSAAGTDVRWPEPEEIEGSFTQPIVDSWSDEIFYTFYLPPPVAGFYEFTVEALGDPLVSSTVLIEVYYGDYP